MLKHLCFSPGSVTQRRVASPKDVLPVGTPGCARQQSCPGGFRLREQMCLKGVWLEGVELSGCLGVFRQLWFSFGTGHALHDVQFPCSPIGCPIERGFLKGGITKVSKSFFLVFFCIAAYAHHMSQKSHPHDLQEENHLKLNVSKFDQAEMFFAVLVLRKKNVTVLWELALPWLFVYLKIQFYELWKHYIRLFL